MHRIVAIITVFFVAIAAGQEPAATCDQLTRLGIADDRMISSNRNTSEAVINVFSSSLWCENETIHTAEGMIHFNVNLTRSMVVYGISSRGDCRTATSSFVKKFTVSYISNQDSRQITEVSVQCTQSITQFAVCFLGCAEFYSQWFFSGVFLSHSNDNRYSQVHYCQCKYGLLRSVLLAPGHICVQHHHFEFITYQSIYSRSDHTHHWFHSNQWCSYTGHFLCVALPKKTKVSDSITGLGEIVYPPDDYV